MHIHACTYKHTRISTHMRMCTHTLMYRQLNVLTFTIAFL